MISHGFFLLKKLKGLQHRMASSTQRNFQLLNSFVLFLRQKIEIETFVIFERTRQFVVSNTSLLVLS
jgi:hypothetical protein